MLFEEEGFIDLPQYPNTLVYFLLKGEEVVYVGQTRHGINRPLSHRNKDFDSIKIQYCEPDKLDEVESKYILKYNPKYNKTYNYAMWYSFERVRNIMKKKFNNPKFTIGHVKKLMTELGIKSQIVFYKQVIYVDDLYKILDRVEEKLKKETHDAKSKGRSET